MTEPKQKLEDLSIVSTDSPRLIEHAFPLKQASIDSVHEKNVRHGHISTLHMWPARRPLAACRAALIATLLPDPRTPEGRKELIEKIGGRVVKKVKKKKLPSGRTEEKIVEETEGGILHWGRETENKETLDWFREEIRKAYGGRAPRVLDPFAGGGAIPLEAMRLGCDVTAIDINPVAWFILKCTLEFPQELAGQKRPLPSFVTRDTEFMESFFKAQGFKGPALRARLEELGLGLSHDPQLPGSKPAAVTLEADLAWHVRAWGWWVLNESRKELAPFYPTYADFEPLAKEKCETSERREPIKVPILGNGTLDLVALNSEFGQDYLEDKKKPRWVPKPTVAYLWARTVACKDCRASIPLLKTRWLCKKEMKRVVLTTEPNGEKTGVVFGVQWEVPEVGGNAAQRRENDKKVGQGTMNSKGVWCPCCGKPGTVAMTMEDIRQEGLAGRLGAVMTAVAVDGKKGKEYRLPTDEEKSRAAKAAEELERVFADVPFGLPAEPTPKGGSGASRAFSVDGFGFDQWYKLFTPRQLFALGTFVKQTRSTRGAMAVEGYSGPWIDAVKAYLVCGISRFLDFANCGVQWKLDASTINHSFVRFALPISWDYAEGNSLGNSAGSFKLCYLRICTALDTYVDWKITSPEPEIGKGSAIQLDTLADIIVTDPPYYDAIPYSDLMDFFYVWLRRMIYDDSAQTREAFSAPLSPKWNEKEQDGELIDDSSRFGDDKEASKGAYEDGMFRAFKSCFKSLESDGKLVIVFAHKHPDDAHRHFGLSTEHIYIDWIEQYPVFEEERHRAEWRVERGL